MASKEKRFTLAQIIALLVSCYSIYYAQCTLTLVTKMVQEQFRGLSQRPSRGMILVVIRTPVIIKTK